MLDNLSTDQEKDGGSRNIVRQEDTENSIDGSNNHDIELGIISWKYNEKILLGYFNPQSVYCGQEG